MSTIIAVTLITAVSTLAGAGVSGYVAFLISRTQRNAQIEITIGQQLERRAIERRQFRRDAYLQFLNQLGKTEQILENLWQSEPPADMLGVANFSQAARNAVSELRITADPVAIEGSSEVASKAMELGVSMTLECAELARTAKTAPRGCALCQHDEDTFIKVSEKRSRLKHELITAAQKSLDDIYSSTIFLESNVNTSEG